MKVRISHFCALSRAEDWQNWLSSVAPDLLESLQKTINRGGCKDVSDEMIRIYKEIYARNFGPKFETLIRNRFPYIIDSGVNKRAIKPAPTVNKVPNKYPRISVIKGDDFLFKNYSPGLLTFPQRIIFSGKLEQLQEAINKFVADKVGVDYVIIGNKAYIEYFESKYKDIVNKVAPEKREIFKYKQSLK